MSPLELIEKYYNKQENLKNILLTHSRQVAQRSLLIACKHPELKADTDFLENAAMLHDIGIVFTNAPGIDCHGTEPYIRHGIIGAELLRKEGMAQYADVAERHTGTGLTLEQILKQDLPLPHQDFSPRTIEEQIICYADKFYSKSHLERELTVSQVRLRLIGYGQASVERFDIWTQLFE